MGKIPQELRQIIAANIRAERQKKYPGRGGAKQCAEDFGVSPQQWSPWECGMRTPDEFRMRKIAEHLGVSVEYLRQDHSPPESKPDVIPPALSPGLLLHGLTCSESENVWQLHKTYSAAGSDGQRWHVSLNIVLSKEAQKEA